MNKKITEYSVVEYREKQRLQQKNETIGIVIQLTDTEIAEIKNIVLNENSTSFLSIKEKIINNPDFVLKISKSELFCINSVILRKFPEREDLVIKLNNMYVFYNTPR